MKFTVYLDDMCLMKVKFQEADLRIAEIKKEAYEFQRDIVKNGLAVYPDRVSKYLEDRLRAKVE